MKIFWTFLAACAAIVTSATLWAFAFAGLGRWGALLSVLVGLVFGMVTFFSCQPGQRSSPSKLDWLLLAIFATVSFRSFCWLLYPVQNVLCVLSPYNLGDLALHIQLMHYFALGVPFWPESPILAGSPLIYPPGMDLFNAVLLLLGAHPEQSLVWVGGIGAALTAFALWQWGRGFALAAFLFAGGACGLTYLLKGQLDLSQEHLDWKNLFLSMFVTQRGLLYALPTGLGLLHAWRATSDRASGELVPFWLQACLYATLPLFNVHTFLFLTFVLVSYFLFSGDSALRKRILTLLLISVLPASAAVWAVTGGFHGGSAFRFLPGWLQGNHPWRFWWNNFGILLPLWLILLFLPSIHRDLNGRCLLFAASVTFIFCCFFTISPWAWDNTKLMIWSYLTVTPLLWQFLLRSLPTPLSAILCFLLFFSGAIALLGGLRSPGYTVLPLPELQDVEVSLASTPPLARFATATDYNHPVALWGRKRVAGYEGHLWSHGLPYLPTLNKLNHLMNGDPNWKTLARELKVDFLFWGPREETCYPHSQKPWQTQSPILSQGSFGTIYDVRQ